MKEVVIWEKRMMQKHAWRRDCRTGSVMPVLDFLVGSKLFQSIASKPEGGCVSGWSHGTWWFPVVATSVYLSSSTTLASVAQVSQDTRLQDYILKHHFSGLLVIFFLSSYPPRFLTSELWYEIQSSLSSEFFSLPRGKTWWGHVFWHTVPRFEPVKLKTLRA